MGFEYPKVDAALTLTQGPVDVDMRWQVLLGGGGWHRKPGQWDAWEMTPRAVAGRRAVWPFTGG